MASNCPTTLPHKERLIVSRRNVCALSQGRKLKNLADLLPFENRELLRSNYEIYFTGLPLSQKDPIPVDWSDGPPLRDDGGFYRVKEGDHIVYRYEIVRMVGRGSFATVYRANDWKTGLVVSVKIMRNVPEFEPLLERELKVLKFLRQSDPSGQSNMVRLLNEFDYRGWWVMVFEPLVATLFDAIKATDFEGLPMQLVKKVACHLLVALEKLQVLGIIHADMKPENVMFTSPLHARVKLIDFGWAWFDGADAILTDYFQSRHYRAPEVILKGPITPAVDMWSFACILAEMASGFPLFPGENKHDQLIAILEVLGVPPASIQSWGKSDRYFSTKLDPFYCRVWEDEGTKERIVIPHKGPHKEPVRGVPGSKDIRTALFEFDGKEYDDAFIDFLLRCLTWDPFDRLTPSEAIRHVWIADAYRSICSQ